MFKFIITEVLTLKLYHPFICSTLSPLVLKFLVSKDIEIIDSNYL